MKANFKAQMTSAFNHLLENIVDTCVRDNFVQLWNLRSPYDKEGLEIVLEEMEEYITTPQNER